MRHPPPPLPAPLPRLLMACCVGMLMAACNSSRHANADTPAPTPHAQAFQSTAVARFDEPWAMAFLPDGRLLVTERPGRLKLVDPATGQSAEITGVPNVVHGGQGGLGDIALHPQYRDNQWIYLSYAEPGEGRLAGAAIARARLVLYDDRPAGTLEELQVIWRQVPKVTSRNHYAHRLLFGRDALLWVSSGERQQFDPAQDLQSNLGKILRLNDDGSPAQGNPFADQGGVAAQVWSLGHRNPLGIAFDAQGRLWSHEMGPRGGDELNLIERGANYGYPIVSNGNHYSGLPIPDHDTHPEFKAPLITWTPVVSPAGLLFYSGELFPQWRGSALIGGLSSQALVRVGFDGAGEPASAREVERFEMGQRIREVEQGPDGAVWLLEDGREGRLLRLTPLD